MYRLWWSRHPTAPNSRVWWARSDLEVDTAKTRMDTENHSSQNTGGMGAEAGFCDMAAEEEEGSRMDVKPSSMVLHPDETAFNNGGL